MIEKIVLNGEEHKLSPEYKDIRNKPSINGIELKEGDNAINFVSINIDPNVDITGEGETPSVINTGTSKNPTLKFSLPKGDTGDTGKIYVPNVDEESGDLSWSLQDNPQDIDSTNIKGPQGERGIGLSIIKTKKGKQTTVVITTNEPNPSTLETLQINDGNDGHNPCLGRLNAVPASFTAAFPNAIEGDYVYVDLYNETTQTATTTIYHCVLNDNTLEWDEGTEINTENPTFATTQTVEVVAIKDIDGKNDTDAIGVLSAEAGKELADITTDIVASENILNPNSIILGRRIKQDGTEADNNTTTADIVYGCTPYIELPDEGLTLNHGITIIGSSVFGVIIYNSDFVKIGKKNTLSNGGSLFVSPTDYTEEAAQGVEDLTPKYVRFNLYKPEISYDGTNDGYAIYKGSTLPSSFIPYFSPRREMKQHRFASGQLVNSTSIKNFDGEDDLEAQGIFSAEAGRFIAETTMELVEGLNILDPSTILVGKKNVEGVVSDILSTQRSYVYGCTDLIEIPDDGLILNKGKGQGKAYTIRAAVYFDSSRNYLGYKEVSGSIPKKCVVSKNDFVGAVYVAFNLPTLDNYSVETNGYAIYVGQTLPTPEYQPYIAPHWEQKKDDTLYEKISSLAGDLSAVKNEFNEEIPYYELTDNAFWTCNEVGDIVSNNPTTTTYVFAASPKIEVNVGEKYIIFGRGGAGTSRLFAVLDENSECIEVAESGVSYTKSNPYVLEITNPDSKYLICSFQGANEHGVYNADLSFAASVNKSLGYLQDEIDLVQGKHKNILLDGASFAYSANSWFSKLCTKLGVVGYNKAVAGTQIFNTVNRLNAGTEYTFEEMENFEIFMMMHVYNRDVADETNLYNDYRDYENETIMPSGIASASTMTYSQAFDYILKKYAANCYALKDNPSSKWYNSPCGKPCIVVVLTSWHDGRTVYNSSVRTLRDKWGFHLVEIDKNIGFSKNQLNPMTEGQQSLLYCYDHPDPQLDNDGEGFGWHPARTGVNGEYIQGRIADIVFSVVSRL